MREIRFSDRTKEITIWILAALTFLFIWKTAHLLIPFVWAIVAAYIFHPLVTFMTRQTGVPRVVWVILIYVAMFTLVAWTAVNVGPVIRDQTIALVESAPEALERAERYAGEQPVLRDLGVQTSITRLGEEVTARANNIAGLARDLALPVLAVVVDKFVRFFVFLIATFYLLLNAEKLTAGFLGLMPKPYQHEIAMLIRRINDSLGAYLRSQLLLIAIMSVATWTFLSVIQVEYALVLGIMTGFLEIIPVIGPYTAGAIAVSVALFQQSTPHGWSHLTLAIVVAVGYFVLRQLEDNLVIPTLIGRVVHLNPLVVIFVLLVGASTAGILGLLIAVPVAAVVRILLQYLYGKLLSREPALVVPIGLSDDPLQRVQAAAEAGAKRLVLVSTDPNDALQRHSTFEEIARLSSQSDLEITFISSDAVARGLAQTHGMRLATSPY
ncbi:MAG: AI-2E family transporter [Chloroflexota bacterium]|nr:AI-2E family transporter [Chloroflexota bacterium]